MTTTTSTPTQFSVKTALTAKRRNRTRRIVENHDYAAFLRRALRAHGRRIANHGDVEALRQLVDLTNDLDDAITHAVTGLRRHGYSWTDIATRLGITKQAAQERWATSTTRLKEGA